jgi:hypothetical protein
VFTVSLLRSLKFKFIYLSRLIFQDNFLFTEWLQQVQDDLLSDLKAQNAPMDDDTVYQIPTFDYNTVDPNMFLNDFVKKGRPAILKNTNVEAMKWTPDSLATRFPDFVAKTRCISGRLGNTSLL